MAHRLVGKITLLIFLGLFSLCGAGEENFILINGTTSAVIREYGPHVNEPVTPACSFNIALSLMGYDAGILKDDKTPTWNFEEGYDDFSESWKASQTPQTWMTRSCLWYSKILGLQLGLKTIQRYLALLEYGNQDMSGGLAAPGPNNPAWISSSLKISPKQQVDFVQKMIHGNLPISSHSIQMSKLLLFKEELPEGWKLYGKTGLGSILGEEGFLLKIRWFVGWIENNNSFFPFAYQMREKEIDVSQTVPRVKQLLEESNVMHLHKEQ
jgi:beta-lactamase class D